MFHIKGFSIAMSALPKLVTSQNIHACTQWCDHEDMYPSVWVYLSIWVYPSVWVYPSIWVYTSVWVYPSIWLAVAHCRGALVNWSTDVNCCLYFWHYMCTSWWKRKLSVNNRVLGDMNKLTAIIFTASTKLPYFLACTHHLGTTYT